MRENLFKLLTEGNSKSFYAHVKKVRGKSNAVTSIQDTEGVLTDSPTQIGNVLNGYFYSVFSADSCCGDFIAKSNNQEKIVNDKSGISDLIDRMKVGKASGPDSLRKEIWILFLRLQIFSTKIFQYSRYWHFASNLEAGKCFTHIQSR